VSTCRWPVKPSRKLHWTNFAVFSMLRHKDGAGFIKKVLVTSSPMCLGELRQTDSPAERHDIIAAYYKR